MFQWQSLEFSPVSGSYNGASIWAQPVQYANGISKETLSKAWILLVANCVLRLCKAGRGPRPAEKMLVFDQHYFVIFVCLFGNNGLGIIFGY